MDRPPRDPAAVVAAVLADLPDVPGMEEDIESRFGSVPTKVRWNGRG